MISDINRALLTDRPSLNLINSVGQIHGNLNSASYWQNVWNNEDHTEEARNLKTLASVIDELQRAL